MNDEHTHAVNGGGDDPWERWVRSHYIQRDPLQASAEEEAAEAQIQEAAQEMLANGEGEADRSHGGSFLLWLGLIVLAWVLFATACYVLHH